MERLTFYHGTNTKFSNVDKSQIRCVANSFCLYDNPIEAAAYGEFILKVEVHIDKKDIASYTARKNCQIREIKNSLFGKFEDMASRNKWLLKVNHFEDYVVDHYEGLKSGDKYRTLYLLPKKCDWGLVRISGCYETDKIVKEWEEIYNLKGE